MPHPLMPEQSASLFAALGDATRLRLLTTLCVSGALSIAQLTATTQVSRQAVTKHLLVLSEAGLVCDLKAGRERLWQAEPARIDQAREALDMIAAQWDRALLRLKDAVEN